MYKPFLVFFLLNCTFHSTKAQDTSNTHFSLSVGVNNSFLEGKRAGIRDYFGYRNYPLNPGFTVGGNFLWEFHPSFNLVTGLMLSFETQAFGYYSLIKRTNGVTKLHLPIAIRYNIPSKSDNNFFIDLGGNVSLSADKAYSKSGMGGDFMPDVEIYQQGKSGFFPTVLIGLGWRCFTPGNRMMEYLVLFHKGFINSMDYELRNLHNGAISTFGFQETLLKIQVNWYFKHKNRKLRKHNSFNKKKQSSDL